MGRKTKSRVEFLATILFVLSLVALVAYFSGAGTRGAQPTIEPVAIPDTEPTTTLDVETEVDESDSPSIQPSGGEDKPSGDAGVSRDSISAGSYYAFDLDSGSALVQLSANREVPIASLAKIATALVVMEYADLEDEVTIEASDLVDPMIDSNMMLVEGDTLTVEQLLQGLLIPSGSDAANALARHVGIQLGGDEESAIALFVDEMNAYTADLGLEHTHLANPTGDDDEESYSSARDIAILAGELMRNRTLAAIVAQPDYSFVSVGFEQRYSGVTTNQLLGVDGVIGVKTGSTGLADGCVVFARERMDGGIQIISILGADLDYEENIIVLDSRWDDARTLFSLIDDEAA